MVQDSEILEIDPPIGLESFFNGKPPKLWCSGEQRILNGSLLGIISAREVDADLALRSSQLLQQLTSLEEVSFIGGWHSPLEEEALRVLLEQSAPIVFCIAKSLNRFVPPEKLGTHVSRGLALLLTHCSPKAKRISRDASLKRNQLVMELATALLIICAPEGSASSKLAKTALRRGKPVLVPDYNVNRELLQSGALPATLENIQKSLR